MSFLRRRLEDAVLITCAKPRSRWDAQLTAQRRFTVGTASPTSMKPAGWAMGEPVKDGQRYKPRAAAGAVPDRYHVHGKRALNRQARD